MNTCVCPALPLHELSWHPGRLPVERQIFPATVRAPEIPLHQLGWMGDGASAVKMTAAPAATVTTAAIASAGAGTAWGAAAGPIGAAVGLTIGIIAGLLAAHAARIKGAKNENAAVAQAVPSFYQTMQSIVSAYNSGQLASSDAENALAQLDAQTMQALRSFVGAPGTSWHPGGNTCGKACTVGCCIYYSYLHPDIQKVIRLLQSGTGGTVNVSGVAGSHYGFPAQPKIPITVTPPSAAQSIEGGLSSLTGGGNILPLLLIAGAAFLVLK